MKGLQYWGLVICVGLLGILLGWWLKTKAIEREAYAKIDRSCTQLAEDTRGQIQSIRAYYRDDGRDYETFKAEREECKPHSAAMSDKQNQPDSIVVYDCPTHPVDTMRLVNSQTLLVETICPEPRHIKLVNEINRLIQDHTELNQSKEFNYDRAY